jgi:hypothetical protein
VMGIVCLEGAPIDGDSKNSFQNEAPPPGTGWARAREGRRERE